MIYYGHGTVDDRSPDTLLHRTFHDTNAFGEHLRRREEPYVDLSDALAGGGEALTIDDCTAAAAAAARLARDHGHEVTLFVNPGYVDSGRPYYFHRLNMLAESASGEREFEGERFLFEGYDSKRRSRKRLKAVLLRLESDERRDELVSRLASLWGIELGDLPPHMRTLNEAELAELALIGVRLENHGWSHANFATLPAARQTDEIRSARAWLRRIDPRFGSIFAPPFGEYRPTAELAAECDFWLGADDAAPPHARGRYVNRIALIA